MTTTKGNAGVVKISTNAIAELTSWSITETEGTVEDTALGDAAHTYLADGLQGWTAQIQGHYYDGDTNGQALLVAGASLSLSLSYAGTGTGTQKFSGTGLVTSIQVGDVANAQIVPFTAQIQGTGALTRGTN
jgi:hypothetical protein